MNEDASRVQPRDHLVDNRRRRLAFDRAFVGVCIVIASISVIVLAVLLVSISWQGAPHLDRSLLTNPPGQDPHEAGVHAALWGTVWVCAVCGAFALPLGVGAAIFLEEFKPRNRALRGLHAFVQLNISNLAGVPSVVYGILGLTAFVAMFTAGDGWAARNIKQVVGTPSRPSIEFGATYFDQFLTEGGNVVLVPVASRQAPLTTVEPGLEVYVSPSRTATVNVIGPRERLPSDPELLKRTLRSDATPGRKSEKSWYYFQIPFGRGVLAGGLTLMLVILPIVIISSQEALRAVPNSLREAALGMGATKWQMVRSVTLPAAVPGIMTGSILSISRAIGEAAPVLMIAGIVYISSAPQHLVDKFTVLPLQIFNWTGRPQEEFHRVAAAAIIVLLTVLLLFNGVAILIRHRMQKPLS